MLNQLKRKLKGWETIHSMIRPPGNFLKERLVYHQIDKTLKNNLEFVLIYQMGKVGSSTLLKSLRKINIPQPIYKVHFLNPQTNQEIRAKSAYTKKTRNELLIPRHLIIDKCFCQKIHRILARSQQLKLITSVRDPISRSISSFFQNITKILPCFQRRLESRKVSVQELINLYWEHPEAKERRYRHIHWFDRELSSVLGIDVFSIDFPKAQGYFLKKDFVENIDLLILKLEKFSQCLTTSLKDFLDLSTLNIASENISNLKKYHELYREFKNEIRFSPEYLDQIYNSQFVQHFYTDEEIEQFKIRWLQ